MPLQLDAGKTSLAMFFKDWQVESLCYLWRIQPEGANSRSVWINVNESLQGQHQQGQHHQLSQRHDRRIPAHLHGDHGQGRLPENIHNKVRRSRAQTTHRRSHNHEATQRIPARNKKSTPNMIAIKSNAHFHVS